MNMAKTLAIVAVVGFMAGPTWAGNVDEDLRQAAQLHRNGETARAMTIWRNWADRGDVDAAYNLAIVHHNGDGVVRNTAEALKWYRVAADRGDRPSQYQLGLMYLTGDGVPANAEEAHRWFVTDRQHHMHHVNSPQMQEWRRQAAALIWQQEMRESLAKSRDNGADVVAELQRRAATVAVATAERPKVAASALQAQ
ncbi:MAG TPA: tetratricopeptide repeat protein [Rhodocyclaceae bacterium]|nr:tetratricopeptide repeat protein [Rhodocyclaceae bacterium]